MEKLCPAAAAAPLSCSGDSTTSEHSTFWHPDIWHPTFWHLDILTPRHCATQTFYHPIQNKTFYQPNFLPQRHFYKHLWNLLSQSVTESPFVNIFSKHCLSQTKRVRELKFQENVHPLPHVMCHVSDVKCQDVIKNINIYFFLQNLWVSRWRACYQWGPV